MVVQRVYMAVVPVLLMLATAVSGEVETMALSEVKPGMRGEWRTAVSGTEVESFELEVLGVASNFLGPQRAVIICEALDSRNKLTGPVQGMSGSPVYIDGKLVGAYSHGYSWPKEQALIIVTPIDHMLEVIRDYPWEQDKPRGLPRVPDMPVQDEGQSRSDTEQAANGWRLIRSDGRLDGRDIGTFLAPTPTPLIASGFSERALRAFKPQFDALGLEVMQAPSGGTSSDVEYSLEPGAPVAAVLMSGDFNLAATGTVTYRDGDTLLAFGHPFFQTGQSQIPMAGAEVITVVQSANMSFKLSNVGPMVGSIYQDRLTGVAGRMGEIPPLTEVSISTNAPNGVSRNYSGKLFENRNLSPLFAAVSLLESLNSTMEWNEEQTFFIDGEVDVEGYGPIHFKNSASGPSGAIDLAVEFWQDYQQLVNNPYEMPRVKSVNFDIDMRDEWMLSSLKSAHVENKRVRPGENIDLALTLYNYHNEDSRHTVSVPVPAGLSSGEQLTVLVADASEAERIDKTRESFVTSVDDIVDQWRHSRSRQYVYIKLLKKAPGLRFEGDNLTDLPPSVLQLYTSPGNNIARESVDEVTLWETQLEVPGEFRGSYRIPITLE